MKTACSLLLLMVIGSLSLSAQQTIVGPAPGRIVNGQSPEDGAVNLREETIWSEDFANGIPATWINTGDPELAVWEYRGPNTNPSSDAGTRGSCLPDDVTFGEPIQSLTADNGFIIFDSNYWDDNVGPCGSFGEGPAPGPHFGTLETPSIDLSAYPSVGLRFNQYCKNYQTESRIDFSVDGGEWMPLWINDVPLNSGESSEDRFDRINVTEQLGGQSDVRLRFVFDGNYYFWMLDDIELFELLQNNIYVESATYGDFNMDDQGHETGYEYMEYSLYPAEMAPDVQFGTNVYNYGAEDQTNCAMEVFLRNELTMDTVFTDVTVATDLDTDEFWNFRADAHQLGPDMAPYTAHFNLTQNEEEDSPDDNHVIRDFEVTDVVYARDRLSTEGIYIPDQAYAGQTYEVGNFFVITSDDQAVESVSIGVGVGSDPNATVYARIYSVSIDNSISATEIASTDEFGIIADSYNNVGDNNVMTIPFPEPVELHQDSAYLVMAGTTAGPSEVFFPISGDSPALTSMVRFFPNSWFYLVRTPLVRMNFGPVSNIEEATAQDIELNVYPNPANAQLNVSYELEGSSNVQLIVYDELGQIVEEKALGNLPAGTQRHQVSTDAWADGWYVITIQTDKTRVNEMVIVRH
ncbi:T9SS type A sorting domain-containing protein [Sanyastnella coralliicola]|uniref:T9SS type A sorting domain-containing protein n=1 Tax=Sanyastnella coralliicola TaxID=3069118 RepID=UPI0027BAE1DF|nr:T9SS type A sorting domain-containing protein [Longitalea sp. SCSIO 12813]